MPNPAADHHQEQAERQKPAITLTPAEERLAERSTAEHGGFYSRFREIASASGEEPPPEKFSSLLDRAELANSANDGQKARVFDALQEQYGNRYVQRVASSMAPSRAKPFPQTIIQRSSDRDVPDAWPRVERSGGQPLDPATQAFMSSRFGHDFSNVRVHNDGAAERAAEGFAADAFTSGRDVYFNRGNYDPGSEHGRHLIAHELAHVVQQDQGAVQGQKGVSHPGESLEHQAEAMSQAALSGGAVQTSGVSPAPSVQRQAKRGAPADAAAPAPPGVNDFLISLAGLPLPLPIADLARDVAAGKLKVPQRVLAKLPKQPLKIEDITLDLDDNKVPTGGSINASVNIPPVEGSGTLNLDKNGEASGDVKVAFRSRKIPGLREVEVDVHVDKKDFKLETDIGFDLPKVTGSLHYKYENGKHSGKGTAKYEGAKLSGSIEVIMSEAGKVSGSGKLEAELFKGLRGAVDVAVDENRNVKVVGKLTVPGQIELFPEKKYEKSFFNFEKKFPLWGITIPVIDVNVGLFAEIHAGAGFRAKFGPAVLRNIELTGEFGSDPEAATEFGLGGEFFLPAGAEIVVNVGGGIGLGLAVADITGGVEAVGVAGLYAALSVRPNFKYSGGKYTISGLAELAGVAQLKLGINAFAKVDVGVWLFKGTVWRKDWTLAEWIWNTGLNVALRANMSYTLGDDFVPDFSFETGQVDPEKLVKDVMPESGSPVPAPPKPATPDKSTFNAEGAAGGAAAGGAPAAAPAAPKPGAAPAQTKPGTAPAPGGAGAPGAKAPENLPPKPAAAGIPAADRTPEETEEVFDYDVAVTEGAPLAAPVLRATKPGKGPSPASKAGKQKAKTHYYDDKTHSWVPRTDKVHLDKDEPFELPASKHEVKSAYDSLAASGELDTSKGDSRGDQRSAWLDAGYPIPKNKKGEPVDQNNDPVANPWQVDHIIELQAGGKDNPSNYQLLDSSANQSSGSTIRGFLQSKKDEHKTKHVAFKKVKKASDGITGPRMTKQQAQAWDKKYGKGKGDGK